eukprot:1160978-Pelagomonas_calceolata.AAC.5
MREAGIFVGQGATRANLTLPSVENNAPRKEPACTCTEIQLTSMLSCFWRLHPPSASAKRSLSVFSCFCRLHPPPVSAKRPCSIGLHVSMMCISTSTITLTKLKAWGCWGAKPSSLEYCEMLAQSALQC